MASRGKKKTTMAKFTREAKLRERRVEKEMRKAARKLDAANGVEPAWETEAYGSDGRNLTVMFADDEQPR